MQPTTASNETKLPRAVLRNSAAIQARIDARNKPEPDDNTPAADPAPPADPAATVPAAHTAEPQTAAPAADPRDTDPGYWKQRFSVTEGILRRERNDRREERENLHQQIAELQGKVTLQATTKPDDEIDITQFYTPAQIETYGDEQCRVMAATAMKAAQKTAQESIAAAVQPLRDREARAAEDAKVTIKQQFEDTMSSLLPNWQELDVDPRWRAWLAEEDENEIMRQTLLNEHLGSGNARAIVKMFKKWQASLAPTPAPVPTPTPPITPSGSGANPGPESTPAPPVQANGKGAPTAAEVKDFYKRAATVRKGQPGYVTDVERAEFEARLALRNAAA